VLEHTELQQAVSPVEEMPFGGIRVRGALILFGCAGEVSRALFDVAEQIVELGGVLRADHPLDLRARLVQLSGLEQREREIVPARVVSRVDSAGAFEMRDGRLQLTRLKIERCELIFRLEAVG